MDLKRWLFVLAVLLSSARTLEAQTAQRLGPLNLSSTVCPGAGCATLAVTGLGGVAVQVTGTFSGTLEFDTTIDNSTFVATQLAAVGTGVLSTTTTTTGLFSGGVGGVRAVRVRFTSYVSGAAVVTIQSAPTSAKCIICAPIASPTFTGVGQFTLNFAGDAAVRAGMKFRRNSQDSGGTPTIGDGYELLFQLQDTNGNYGNIAGVDGRLVTVAPSTMIGRLEFNAKASGTFNTTFDDVVGIADGGSGFWGFGSHWRDITTTPTELLHAYNGNMLVEATGASGMDGFKLTNQSQTWRMGMDAAKDWHLFDATGAREGIVADTAGQVGINIVPTVTFHVSSENGATAFNIDRHDSTTNAPAMRFRKSRGTRTSPTKVLNGDDLGAFVAQGYQEVTPGFTQSTAALAMTATEDFTATAQGSKLRLAVMANGGVVRTDRVIITGAGVEVGGPTLTVANVAANSCGTTAATITGNANAGQVVVGATSGTQCRIAIPQAVDNRWHVTCTNETTANLCRGKFVDTTHFDLLGTFVAGDTLSYIALGR